ncbi:hypothetical protein U0C82_01960 [Fulvimarina sp. 2208YS6-2-32]|uniref:Uncharacterized protein n=1 Tax=Fulvimarina uroteuthidis TaxID=3098149 RepID=A0ABU5HXP8_9HYPH|nr:hypothetical protein [Fulvimarina sp. 2208YS6-2-32]MDY8107914.1 hypothetical protein [Fulvimarina sp. 2208YS6-2-32]
MGGKSRSYCRLKFTIDDQPLVAERWIETTSDGAVCRAIDFLRNGEVGGVSADGLYRDVPLPAARLPASRLASHDDPFEAEDLSGQLFCDTWRILVKRTVLNA